MIGRCTCTEREKGRRSKNTLKNISELVVVGVIFSREIGVCSNGNESYVVIYSDEISVEGDN